MLPASHLEQLCQRVEAETGMDLAGSRFSRFQAAVEKILSQQPSAKLDRLMERAEELAAFLENLTAELTVGESFFFRNEHHFRALREHVVPEILRANAAQREVRVWSAGCATGEEPYSVAILLHQLLAERGQWQVSILGTDLNFAFLERARLARYRQWSFRQTDIHQDAHYFSTDGEWFTLFPSVRDQVRFAYLNLVKDVYPSALAGTLGQDLILFRNVAIYLKPEVTKAIVERFQRALRPGGWLLLGEVELPLAQSSGWERCQLDQATFLRKPAGMPAEPVALGQLAAPTVPVALLPGNISVPSAPMLPPWSPLPWTTGGSPAPTARATATPGAKTLWDQVEQAARRKDFADAERGLDRIAPMKDRANSRLRYIQLLLEMAEIARARQMLDVCLREEPLTIGAHLLKAGFAEEVGDLVGAEQACRSALYIDRQCPMAHFHLGLVLHQQGNQAGAERSLLTTLDLIRGKDSQALAPFGEGMCFGRLQEMANLLLACLSRAFARKSLPA